MKTLSSVYYKLFLSFAQMKKTSQIIAALLSLKITRFLKILAERNDNPELIRRAFRFIEEAAKQLGFSGVGCN